MSKLLLLSMPQVGPSVDWI